MSPHTLGIYFSDVFDVSPEVIDEYGAFNISLINDLPLFVDPFLLFNSDKPEYQQLHEQMIRYVRFLRDKAVEGAVNDGLLEAWFTFREVKQNWLGFSKSGNSGSGLGRDFARALRANLHSVFSSFGNENITKGSHLEKLCLIRGGVGRDNISDFCTTLVKQHLLEYTQTFARQQIHPKLRKEFIVEKVVFNYETQSWHRGRYELPAYGRDFVILTPKDILTRDETWINRPDLINQFDEITASLPDESLRALVNNHFLRQLTRDAKEKDRREAKANTVQHFPELIEHYIRKKEDEGDKAESISNEKVRETEELFGQQVRELVVLLRHNTEFYDRVGDTYTEARKRVLFLKDVIENKDGYRLFYLKGKPVRKEQDLQILYRLTSFATPSDVNREVNNGRGPVDFKVSRGRRDAVLVECKLASNSKLKSNLQNQVEVYQKANDAPEPRAIKVILFFSADEEARVLRILDELKLRESQDLILIDARNDNKPSGSNVVQ